MSIRLKVLSACVLAAAVPTAWSSGSAPMPSAAPSASHDASPEGKAKDLYNDGIREVKKADKNYAASLQATDAQKKSHAQEEAKEYYSSGLALFQQATQSDPHLAEAWNYLGYTNRHLGNYDAALQAYGQALTLKPGFPEAIEYRGEAYLGLNRVSDAKQAYLDLFTSNRTQAAKLLTAMRGWLDAQKASASADGAAVADLDKWIQERSTIAGQTAALTREGTAASWN